MIQHPILATISLIIIIIVSWLEIRYYRAGMPKTKGWVGTLFLCGASATVSFGLSLIPNPIVMFQSAGTCSVMLFVLLMGGIIAVYTAPKAMQEAAKNRDRLQSR